MFTMARAFGPTDATRVIRALGRLRTGESESGHLFSRRGFLQVSAGSVLVMTMFGAGKAAAKESAGSVEVYTQKTRMDLLDRALDSRDLELIAGKNSVAGWQAAARTAPTEEGGIASYSAPIAAFQHAAVTRRGSDNEVVTINLFVDVDDVAYIVYDYSQPINGIRTRGVAFTATDDSAQIRTLSSSFNGSLTIQLDDIASNSFTNAAVPCGGCYWPGDGRTHGYYQVTPCKADFSAACILGAAGCVGCTAACASTFGVGCWFCLITSCGSYLLGCCGKGAGPVCTQCPDGE